MHRVPHRPRGRRDRTRAARLLAGCTAKKSGSDSGGGDSGTVKVGLITKTDSNPYFISMRDAAQAASRQGRAPS